MRDFRGSFYIEKVYTQPYAIEVGITPPSIYENGVLASVGRKVQAVVSLQHN
jgi:hypothetical protein